MSSTNSTVVIPCRFTEKLMINNKNRKVPRKKLRETAEVIAASSDYLWPTTVH